MNIFMVAISMVFIALLLSELHTMWRKYKMHRTESRFREHGILPYGSGVCHGMVVAKDKMIVIKDQKNTAAWYSRLDD